VLQVLDPAAVRRWTDVSVDLLDDCRAELDRINVFPVADSDTGTNLLLTVRSAADAIARQRSDALPAPGAHLVAAAAADGALRGARGNSGVIVSQLFRGVAEVLAGGCDGGCADGLTGPGLAEALSRSDDLARAAVSRPVEGTVLTVLSAAAAAALAVSGGGTGPTSGDGPASTSGDGTSGGGTGPTSDGGSGPTLHEVATAAVRGAREALTDTPRLLPVLARAGVVDAGGYGLVVLLRALVAVVEERPVQPSEPIEALATAAPGAPGQRGWVRDRDALVGEREGGSTRFEYEVMFLLTESTPGRVRRLRARLDDLGDSVALVGSGGVGPGGLGTGAEVWNVHVHCNDVGAAIEAGVVAGRPRRITVVRFLDQEADARAAEAGGRFPHARAVVAVVGAASIAQLIAAEGVSTLLAAPGRTPSPNRIAAAAAGTRARHVVLLPNDPELTAVAEEAAELAWAAGQEAVVVPTSSVLQGLAALAVHDPTRRAGDDVVAMAEAAAATRTGVVQIAATEALTWVGRCEAGDVLGLVDGEVVLIEHDLALGSRLLVERMLHTGGELVTVLLGDDAPEGLGEMLESHLRRAHPEVDVQLYRGGPTGQPLALGVE
jgi:dihydroxyacetone kinase-like predicted kinase